MKQQYGILTYLKVYFCFDITYDFNILNIRALPSKYKHKYVLNFAPSDSF